jgi:2-dehydro-3-deoxy-D-arabinonate dehydratase
MIRIFRTKEGIYAEKAAKTVALGHDEWDSLINQEDAYHSLKSKVDQLPAVAESDLSKVYQSILAPIGSQEVWASGVTYLRSRDARMEESENAKTAYDRVYDAARPELFFKSQASRVAGPHQEVYIRRDSTWNVPEPEITLCINAQGKIIGYTAGNDMSSRSIEGENTLYLPQAKTYERSAALGPCLVLVEAGIDRDTYIDLKIYRGNDCIFHGKTQVNKMKRNFEELKDYLLRGLYFETGCYLMTGTGIVPDSSFTLDAGDEIHIRIDGVGTLVNRVKWY